MPFDNTTDTRDMLNEAYAANHFWEATSEAGHALCARLAMITEEEELRLGHAKRRRNKRDAQRFLTSVETWVPNLLLNVLHEKSEGWLYCPSASKYLKGTNMSDRNLRSISATWNGLDLQEVFPACRWHDDDGGSRYSRGARYRATERFLQEAASFGITPENAHEHFAIDKERDAAITVRNEKKDERKGEKERGELVFFGDTAQTEALQERVRDINRHLDRFTFTGMAPPRLKRGFNRADDPHFDYDMGGRLYAQGPNNFQSLTPKERSSILIDGEPVVELDYQASHPRIAFALIGHPLDPSADPYSIPGVNRWLVKKAMVSLLSGVGSSRRWRNDTKDKFVTEVGQPWPDLTLPEVINAIHETYPFLGDVCRDRVNWYRLQFIESEILISAVEELKEEGIPALPIHDSLIVRSRDRDQAEQALLNRFKADTGVFPKVTLK